MKFYVAHDKKTNKPRKVIAVTTYRDQTVRGVAVCDERDPFNIDVGMELARKQCEVKIAKKRCEKAHSLLSNAISEKNKATAHQLKMEAYVQDALEKYSVAKEGYENLRKSFA